MTATPALRAKYKSVQGQINRMIESLMTEKPAPWSIVDRLADAAKACGELMRVD